MRAFSDMFLVRYRERLIMYKAQRSVFSTVSGAGALSGGFLLRHRERV